MSLFASTNSTSVGEFAAPFSDSWLAVIESLHSVYGMQAVKLNPKMDGLTILFDASRVELAQQPKRRAQVREPEPYAKRPRVVWG